MSKPAHKQDDPDKFPGQIKYEIPLDTNNMRFNNPKYLSDVIERIQREENPPKKLTFDEWWHQRNDDTMFYEHDRVVWLAAQENK